MANVTEKNLTDFHQNFLSRYNPVEILDYLVSQFSDAVEKIAEAAQIRKAGVWLDLKSPAMKKFAPLIEKLGFEMTVMDLFILNEPQFWISG